ncbi:MAG: hypothetical protein AOA65_0005 [Candidatus Bathyarchaeota archaeon BA1]|nr:MAG: hypothetical protein AOA65_0005 [Candidatus Bathyarchaeota archaeon BA1]
MQSIEEVILDLNTISIEELERRMKILEKKYHAIVMKSFESY